MDVVKELFDLGAQPSETILGTNEFHFAVRGGSLEVAKYLVEEKGYDASYKVKNPLHVGTETALGIAEFWQKWAETPAEKEKFTPLIEWLHSCLNSEEMEWS